MEKVDIQSGIGYFDLDIFIQMNNYIIDVFYVTDEKSCPSADIHSGSYYELNFFCNGNAKITCNNMTYSITSGTFVLIPPNTEYSIQVDKNIPPRKIVTVFVIDQVDISKINSNLQMYQDDYNVLFKLFKSNKLIIGQVGSTFNAIMDEYNGLFSEFSDSYNVVKEYRKNDFKQNLIQELSVQTIGSKCKQSFCLSTLFIDFLRTCPLQYPVNLSQQKPLTPYWLKYSIGVIIENDYKDITLETLALRLRMSTRQVQRYLSQYYNMTFKEMLTNRRIKKAKEMLLETDLPIDEIGTAVGFRSKNYFYKKFKEETGITPVKFRASI